MNDQQKGFTLLELMVAMVIFAMLAMAGWQIMASISKSRDRAKIQIDQLSELEYAYLQLSQDFAQVSNYVVRPQGTDNASLTLGGAIADNVAAANATFQLTAQQVSFIRFANPDPRFNPAPVLSKVNYTFSDGKLIRQRFYQLDSGNETPSSSVLLTDVKDLTWTALTPQRVSNFPDAQTLQQVQQAMPATTAQTATQAQGNTVASAAAPSLIPYQQLPKGVEVKFTYHDEPMVWRFALPNQAPNLVASNVSPSPVPPGPGPNPPPGPTPPPNPEPEPQPDPTPPVPDDGINPGDD